MRGTVMNSYTPLRREATPNERECFMTCPLGKCETDGCLYGSQAKRDAAISNAPTASESDCLTQAGKAGSQPLKGTTA